MVNGYSWIFSGVPINQPAGNLAPEIQPMIATTQTVENLQTTDASLPPKYTN